MTILPESIDPEDEISILWEHTDEGARVTASLGDAKIVVESEEGSEACVVLVQALPAIMNAAYDAMEQEEA